MARRMTPAQARAALRRLQNEQKQAINQYNAAVRKTNRAIDQYNREAKAHNARVRANRQRLRREIARLNRTPTATRTVIQASTVTLHAAYERVDVEFDSGLLGDEAADLVDLAEAEVANSASVANAFAGEAAAADSEDEGSVGQALAAVDEDLYRRWQGALFALDPRNPEAARHFCTSAREVVLALIERGAPDRDVLAADPAAPRAQDGRVARRAKLHFLLGRRGVTAQSMRTFVEVDVDDVMTLVREVNGGTHGTAGTYSLSALTAIKGRLVGALRLLTALVDPA